MSFEYVFVRHVAPSPGAGPMLNVPADNFPIGYLSETAFALAIPPTAINYNLMSPTVIKMTQGGASIQRAPFRRYDVSMTLDFGLNDKQGFSSIGLPRHASGPELIDEFIEWIHDLWDSSHSRLKTFGVRRMTWHDTHRNVHMWVEPTSIQLSEGGESQLYPIVQLSMMGYELTGWPTSGMGLALTMSAQMNEWIEFPMRYIEIGLGLAEFTVTAIEGVTSLVSGILDSADIIVEAIDVFSSIINATSELVSLGPAWYRRIEGEIASAIEGVTGALDGFDAATDSWRAVAETRDAVRQLQRSIQAGALLSSSGYLGQTGPGATTATGSGPRGEGEAGNVHTVVAGETLMSISSALFGHAQYWQMLVEMNGILPPFTVEPGTKLLIPANAFGMSIGDAGSAAGESGTAESDLLLYGEDLSLDKDGDLSLEPGEFPADIETVSGVPCVVQGIGAIQLQTTAGENLMFPTMGLPAAIGDIPNIGAGVFLTHVTDQLYRDDRVVNVLDGSATAHGLGYDVKLTAVLKTGRRMGVIAGASRG